MIEVPPRLLGYLNSGRVHHALCLVGGPSKYRIAKQLAKAAFCRKVTPRRAICGECSSCRRIEKEIHPDVILVRDDGDGIKIEPLRQWCRQMEAGPVEGDRKIFILDEAHRLNASAANAFLKTLEEPLPGRWFWLLTSQPAALLPTISSRCLEFRLTPETAVDNKSAEWRRLLETVLDEKNPAPLLEELSEKEDCLLFVRQLQTELRHATLAAHKLPLPAPALPALAKLEPDALIRRFEGAVELESRLRSNANPGLMLEALLRREFF